MPAYESCFRFTFFSLHFCVFECNSCLNSRLTATVDVFVCNFQVHNSRAANYLLQILITYSFTIVVPSECVKSYILWTSLLSLLFSWFFGFSTVLVAKVKNRDQNSNKHWWDTNIMNGIKSRRLSHSINEDDEKPVVNKEKKKKLWGFFSHRQSTRLSQQYILFRRKNTLFILFHFFFWFFC